VADNALFTQATQGQLGGTGIGTFSDRLRDAVHGGSPVDGASTFTQGFGTGLFTDPNGREARTGEPGTVNDGGADEAADLALQTDLVRLGLAGNLRDFAFVTADGELTRGEDLDYRGSPAGYADSPEEVVTYVDAHDNETLFDLLALKLPQGTTTADRVRMNTVSLATAALAQTPSFWHAGTDLLRSKSLDRNSYDSGDWFNAIDWSGQDNGFGRGLPMAADNSEKWDVMRPLLADPALKPSPADIATSADRAAELLELRSSTRLFRLGSADAIRQKVTFPGSGPDAAPGVIVMAVDDRLGKDADRRLDGLVTVFNASPDPVTVEVPGWAGRDLRLSKVQADGGDRVVKQTRWDRRAGVVTVPGRTVAVLEERQR
jgi:pullulanase-type alpha-1,6-glucosidase